MSDDESLIGDVSQLEQQLVDLFHERGGDGPDEVAPPSPGGEGEGSAPPEVAGGDASPPVEEDLSFVEPVADAVSAPVEQIVSNEDDEDDDEGGEGSALYIDEVFDGVPVDNLATARAVYDWYSALDEYAIQQIDATLSGQYVLVPQDQIQFLQQNWDLIEQIKQGKTDSLPSESFVDDEYDNQVDPNIDALNQRIAQLEAERMQEQTAAQLQQSSATIDATYNQWREQYPQLSDADFSQLEAMVVQSGIFGPLAAQYGDAQATVMALDQMLYANPELRAKAVEPLVNERLQQELQAAQEQQARGQRASSISGAAAGPPGETAVNLDPEEAMIEEITRALRG